VKRKETFLLASLLYLAMCEITVYIGLGIVTVCYKHIYFYVFLIAKLMDTNLTLKADIALSFMAELCCFCVGCFFLNLSRKFSVTTEDSRGFSQPL